MLTPMAPPEPRWKRVRSPYDLRRVERFHAVGVAGAGPVAVTTSGQPWHYAAGIRYQLPWYDRSCRRTQTAVIRVHATIERGQVGIGVTDDEHRFLDETIRRAGDGEDTFNLLVGNLGAARWLIVRDGGEPDGPAHLVIRRISVFRLPAVGADDMLRPPDGLQLVPVAGWSRYYGERFTELAEKLRAFRYQLLARPLPMPWLDGLRVLIHPCNEMSRALYVSGLYEPTDAVVIGRLLPPGGTFFDLGANMGVFSLLAAQRLGPAGEVHAFEPSAREYTRLVDNLRLNGLAHRVRAERAALADRAGCGYLRVAEDTHSGLNTLGDGFAYAGVAEAGLETVPVLRLDDYVRAQGVQRLDVIKMDIEGGEGRALAGAGTVLRGLRPRIVFEVNESALGRQGSSAAQVQDLLAGHGYRLWQIDDATADLLPLADLTRSASGNVVALPGEALVP